MLVLVDSSILFVVIGFEWLPMCLVGRLPGARLHVVGQEELRILVSLNDVVLRKLLAVLL
jgi:hypothetical protein